MSIIRDLQFSLKGMYGTLIRFILINCAVFLLVNILISFAQLGGYRGFDNFIAYWIDLPSSPALLLRHPWTIFTYMFVHFGLWHLVSNMLWLYYLGRIFCDFLGGFRLAAAYITGGLLGGLLFVLLGTLFPRMGGDLEGASAGVMAIVIAIAAHSPDYTIFVAFPLRFSIKLKWVGLIAFILTTVLDFANNTGGKISHIGGAAFGLIYGMQLHNARGGIDNFFDWFRPKSDPLRRRKSKLRVAFSRSQKKTEKKAADPRNTVQKRIDEILDKISRSGYDSLSKEEKEFLQKNHDRF